MTLYQITKELERIALSQPNIRYAGDGDLYRDLNACPSRNYAAFYLTNNRHYSDETQEVDRYSFNMFYIDRLVNVEGDNALEIQSIGKESLMNIIRTFNELYDGEIYGTIEWQVFTQRFSDECAGIYAIVTLQVPMDALCID